MSRHCNFISCAHANVNHVFETIKNLTSLKIPTKIEEKKTFFRLPVIKFLKLKIYQSINFRLNYDDDLTQNKS